MKKNFQKQNVRISKINGAEIVKMYPKKTRDTGAPSVKSTAHLKIKTLFTLYVTRMIAKQTQLFKLMLQTTALPINQFRTPQ